MICPATVNSVNHGDYRIDLALDGWSSLNNFKVDYYSRDIFPVGWCQSAGLRLSQIGGNRKRMSKRREKEYRTEICV